uniref:Uncharacterized protein n=1 Tax=Anguilla anguilla TaxID=7936 RepID=A0A0E9RMY0_ANGAN
MHDMLKTYTVRKVKDYTDGT